MKNIEYRENNIRNICKIHDTNGDCKSVIRIFQ